jgi:hypothetical protein
MRDSSAPDAKKYLSGKIWHFIIELIYYSLTKEKNYFSEH